MFVIGEMEGANIWYIVLTNVVFFVRVFYFVSSKFVTFSCGCFSFVTGIFMFGGLGCVY